MRSHLNWIHLSDLHFTYKNYSTNTMRDLLLKYLRDLRKDQEFDFVVITGDIVYQGAKYNNDLIKFIEEILNSLQLTKDDLFIVPGNHDLKRNLTTTLALETIAGQKELLSQIDKDLEKDLVKRQRSFFTFIKKVTNNHYKSSPLHNVIELDNFNIIHLNTSWGCGRQVEEGTLRIGLDELSKTLKQVEESKKINIAIGHHTIDCFHETERDRIINRMVDHNVDMYLAGHVHKPKYHFEANNSRTIPMFVCGAGMVDDFATNSFIMGSIELESKDGKISYHSWNNEIEKWDIDPNIGRKVLKGDLNFGIDRLKKKPEILSNEAEITFGVDEDEFREFLIEFHGQFKSKGNKKFNQVELDIKRKFSDMKCNNSIEREFLKLSAYFPIVNQIMNNPTYLDGDTKLIIPSVIVAEYQNVFDDFKTGTKIVEAMVSNMYSQYKNMLSYPKVRLCIYLKIMIYWSIQECDIFNDIK